MITYYDNKFKVIKTIWPFSRKLPVLSDKLPVLSVEQCNKLQGEISNHVRNLTSSTWHALDSNTNVYSISPKYTVMELGHMEKLLWLCKYSKIPSQAWKWVLFLRDSRKSPNRVRGPPTETSFRNSLSAPLSSFPSLIFASIDHQLMYRFSYFTLLCSYFTYCTIFLWLLTVFPSTRM